MIELVRERIAWMDREGLQSWNTSDYLEIYPQDYYEERAREGVLFALARASDGKILCAGALLETDERWPDSLPAVYVHHLVSGTEARGRGPTSWPRRRTTPAGGVWTGCGWTATWTTGASTPIMRPWDFSPPEPARMDPTREF